MCFSAWKVTFRHGLSLAYSLTLAARHPQCTHAPLTLQKCVHSSFTAIQNTLHPGLSRCCSVKIHFRPMYVNIQHVLPRYSYMQGPFCGNIWVVVGHAIGPFGMGGAWSDLGGSLIGSLSSGAPGPTWTYPSLGTRLHYGWTLPPSLHELVKEERTQKNTEKLKAHGEGDLRDGKKERSKETVQQAHQMLIVFNSPPKNDVYLQPAVDFYTHTHICTHTFFHMCLNT